MYLVLHREAITSCAVEISLNVPPGCHIPHSTCSSQQRSEENLLFINGKKNKKREKKKPVFPNVL